MSRKPFTEQGDLIGCHSIRVRGGVSKNEEIGIQVILENAFLLRFTLAEAEGFRQLLTDCIESTLAIVPPHTDARAGR